MAGSFHQELARFHRGIASQFEQIHTDILPPRREVAQKWALAMAILALMKDLRTVGRSDDGESIELLDLDGNSYNVRVTDHLKSLVNQPRLSRVLSEEESAVESISIKEIQARLRAGESMESIAERGNISFEKVERFSAPILQERSYIISLAQKSSPKKGAPALLDLISDRLIPRGVEMKETSWNAYRNEDGSWHLTLNYPTRDGVGEASWTFDHLKRSIKSFDDGARWLLGEEIAQHRNESHLRALNPSSEESTPPRLISIRSNPIDETSIPESSEVRSAPRAPIAIFGRDSGDKDELDFADELGQDSDENYSQVKEVFDDEPAVDEIPSDARRDGVTRRVSIPSWDDIMFGPGGKKSDS